MLCGVAALAAWSLPATVAAVALWQFALVSYIGVLVNFNPLMELDGERLLGYFTNFFYALPRIISRKLGPRSR